MRIAVNENLPRFLTPKEFRQQILPISEGKLRQYIHEAIAFGEGCVIKNGRAYFLETESFIEFLKKKTQE